MKRVLIVCGTGIATSTVIAEKLRSHLGRQGVDVRIEQTKVSELHRGARGYDLVMATTQIPGSVDAPVVNGMPLLTGDGQEDVLADVAAKLTGGGS